MKVLSQAEIQEKLTGLRNWVLTPEGIQKRYELDSFASVMNLVNRVAELAEEADHHPDIIINYNKVTFALITHYAGGVTHKDFALAARIDALEQNR